MGSTRDHRIWAKHHNSPHRVKSRQIAVRSLPRNPDGSYRCLMTPRENSTARRTLSVSKGFSSLNLDPSPRLRKLRQETESKEPVKEIWTSVRRALIEGARSVERTIRPTG